MGKEKSASMHRFVVCCQQGNALIDRETAHRSRRCYGIFPSVSSLRTASSRVASARRLLCPKFPRSLRLRHHVTLSRRAR
jgi:hypothetical protein